MKRTPSEQFEYLAGMFAGFIDCDVEHAETLLLRVMLEEGGAAAMFARERMGIS